MTVTLNQIPKELIMKQHKFTLVELLVVLAIIGVLASLLFPSLSKARYDARTVSCVNNLKQAGIAIFMYAQDNDHAVVTNNLINTIGAEYYFQYEPDNEGVQRQVPYRFGGGGSYLGSYLGDNTEAYTCPASEHIPNFGLRADINSSTGTYVGINFYYTSQRKLINNYVTDPIYDEIFGWKGYKRKPLLLDAVRNASGWGGNWDNSASTIHQNTSKLPILIDDGSVILFNRAATPGLLDWGDGTIVAFVNHLLQTIN